MSEAGWRLDIEGNVSAIDIDEQNTIIMVKQANGKMVFSNDVQKNCFMNIHVVVCDGEGKESDQK